MPKRLSILEVNKRFSDHGFRLQSNKYVNINKRLSFNCKNCNTIGACSVKELDSGNVKCVFCSDNSVLEEYKYQQSLMWYYRYIINIISIMIVGLFCFATLFAISPENHLIFLNTYTHIKNICLNYIINIYEQIYSYINNNIGIAFIWLYNLRKLKYSSNYI
jgi:hypothetical protein